MVLTGVGLVQAIAGAWAVQRFVSRRPQLEPAHLPSVTVLKPLHGDEPLLDDALGGLCRQDYPSFQVVFGVSDAADTALPVVHSLKARFPACDISVVVDDCHHGVNLKVGNLINMLPMARHDVLVISDSDVHVAPDWLRRLVSALDVPGVGLVTTVYAGTAPSRTEARWSGGIIRSLGISQINQYFLPGALLARAMGRQDCLGATMMLRRHTLERLGGLPALVNHLADDNVLGRLVQGLGLRVELADTIVATTVPEVTIFDLWHHELRWSRTIRALVPAQFAASVLQYPLAWAALSVLLGGGGTWFLLAWAIRAATAWATDRALGLANRSTLWLLPVRELMSVAVMAASYASRRVDWRGHTLQAEGFNPR